MILPPKNKVLPVVVAVMKIQHKKSEETVNYNINVL